MRTYKYLEFTFKYAHNFFFFSDLIFNFPKYCILNCNIDIRFLLSLIMDPIYLNVVKCNKFFNTLNMLRVTIKWINGSKNELS